MTDQDQTQEVAEEMALLRGLLDFGARLYVCRDRQQMLDTILAQARGVTRAEAGSLYLVQKDRLLFVAVQNDKMDTTEIARYLLGKEMPISAESLAGFVASTGEIMSIPDSHRLPAGSPFRINRDFDASSGYHTRSVLAIPLRRPDGSCVGVLELLNRLDPEGGAVAFPNAEGSGILSLASMAAVTISNALLQEELKAAHLDTIIRLSVVVEHRDNVTAQHVRRISRTARLIAETMKLDQRQVELIECAAPMHDVGKVGIPDAVLHKPGPLTPEERRIIEQHALIGADILGHPHNDLIATAHDIAVSHHERWDGGGYPYGLTGTEIPLSGRIVALADVLDALLARRCYKDAYSEGTALDIIRSESGKQFDPTVVEAFFRVADRVLEPYLSKTASPVAAENTA